jgi:hypothetical protein
MTVSLHKINWDPNAPPSLQSAGAPPEHVRSQLEGQTHHNSYVSKYTSDDIGAPHVRFGGIEGSRLDIKRFSEQEQARKGASNHRQVELQKPDRRY